MSRTLLLVLSLCSLAASATTLGYVSPARFLFGIGWTFFAAATLSGLASAFARPQAQFWLYAAGFILTFYFSAPRAAWWVRPDSSALLLGYLAVGLAWHFGVRWIAMRMLHKPSQSNQPLHPTPTAAEAPASGAGERRRYAAK